MKRHFNYKPYCVIILFFLLQLSGYAQISAPFADSIFKKIDLYHSKNNQGTLFLHFDKNIYTNNENVWFTAYLVNSKNVNAHNTLSVALVNADKKISVKGLFVMDSGIAFGNFFLPDTIAPGNYNFFAFTNQIINGLPAVNFIQPITIKTTAESSFTALIGLDSSKKTEKKVFVKLTDKSDLPLLNNEVQFKIIDRKKPFIVKKTTDIFGKAEISVPVDVQAVEAMVNYNKVVKTLKFEMPDTSRKLNVKFYPESGNLVANITSTVGWETKYETGDPMQCSAILYENNRPIDTIFTEASGLGRFNLCPKTGATYSVEVINFRNNKFNLPVALTKGDVLTVAKGLPSDTLIARLTASESGKVYLMVHNYDKSFYLLPIQLSALKPRSIKIDLSILPRGVAEITILDSLQRPLAERLFFAGYKKENILSINTEKVEYKTRQKVKVSLDLKSALADSVKGAVSIACVQDVRIDPDKLLNIESYVKLQSKINIDDARKYQLEFNESNKPYLENVLLVKGWRRYNWSDMLTTTAADSALKYDSVKFGGYVTKWMKPVSKPMQLMYFADSLKEILNTDSLGRFNISYAKLLLSQDKKVSLFTNVDEGYDVTFNDPYKSIYTNWIKALENNAYQPKRLNESTDAFLLKGLNRSIQLRDVNIKSKKDPVNYISGQHLENFVARFTDYVCINNILNCPNHRAGTPPVDGGIYWYMGQLITYHRNDNPGQIDNKNLAKMDGIWYSKEFYPEDYEKNNPKEPELQTTVYWKNLLPITNKKTVDLSFYTSDITGSFKIIVQGITSNNDVVYGTASFKVSK